MGPRPWALEIAFNCLDLETGAWKHLPHAGGWHEQDDDELAVVWWAWRTWKHLKDNRSQKWSDAGEVMLLIDAAQAEYGEEEIEEDGDEAETPCGAPWEW
jgi:hypothetical protein